MLEIKDHGRTREIRLSRPPANALNPALVTALGEALNTAAAEADAVVLSGLPGMFSAGLDVPELIRLDRPEFTLLWHQFVDLQKTIARMPVPIVFALTGHAPAGAIILGVLGDYRIMPVGPYKTGLNEVHIGLVVPEPPFEALTQLIGTRAAEKMITDGELMLSEQAAEIGLVDELVPFPDAVVPRAIEWCEERLSLPRQAMKATRDMARRHLHEIFEHYDEARGDLFVEIWFSESTQARLKYLVANLKKSS